MKKINFFAIVMIFTTSSTFAYANKVAKKSNSENSAISASENKLTEAELNSYKMRIDEINDMDKSDLSADEKKELREELRGIKKNVDQRGGTIYIGGATLILIIILLIILL